MLNDAGLFDVLWLGLVLSLASMKLTELILVLMDRLYARRVRRDTLRRALRNVALGVPLPREPRRRWVHGGPTGRIHNPEEHRGSRA
jgi:hypothetical protein